MANTLPRLKACCCDDVHCDPQNLVIGHTSGVSIGLPDWWLNMCGSNIELFLRLNVDTLGSGVVARRIQAIEASIEGAF